jgi:CRISPR-associated exonuclease Cas4
MYAEADLLPLSALQHLVFCERQCALIHLEQQWEENRLTAEGRILHDRVDEPDVENRPGLRIVRALKIRSLRLGLSGQADVVEFHEVPEGGAQGVALPGARGRWQPFPVEYKRGKPKTDRCDEVQLCAQALCLEEMLEASVPAGALFYGIPRRRTDVAVDQALRAETERRCARLHAMIDSGVTPAACYSKKCDSCSLLDVCRPKALGIPPASGYLAALLRDTVKEVPD